MTRRLTPALRALAAGLALAFAGAPLAATEPADHLNLREPQRPGYRPPASEAPFQLPPVSAPESDPGVIEGETILVRRIVLHGNTVLAEDELETLIAPYVGRPVNVAELEELRQRLSRLYVDRGYVNSGALPARAGGEPGSVVFDIVEGRLSQIRLRGLDGLDENYVAQRLAGTPDAPLNADELRERYQLLLTDPLFERMNARLIPGARLGESILDVEIARARPYRLEIHANNHRPPSIGSAVVGIAGTVRNLTGRGDWLDAGADVPIGSIAGVRTSLGWHVPLNYRGTLLEILLDHGNSMVVEEPMRMLEIRSILDSASIGLSQTLIETLGRKFSVGVNRVARENRTTLLGKPFSFIAGEPDGVTRAPVWRLWQELSLRSETQVLALRSTFSFVRNNLQEIAGVPASSSPTPQPDRRYRIWLGQAQYAGKLGSSNTQLIVRGNVQSTSSALLGLDGMAIGGVGTVRGYRENQLIRDRGVTASVELDFPILRPGGDGLALDLRPFYDYGRGRSAGGDWTALASIGIATRMSWRGLRVDLALAHRLKSVPITGNSLQEKGVHLQLAYDF